MDLEIEREVLNADISLKTSLWSWWEESPKRAISSTSSNVMKWDLKPKMVASQQALHQAEKGQSPDWPGAVRKLQTQEMKPWWCTWFGVLWWRKLSPLLTVDSCDATGWAAGPRDCQRAGLLAHLAGALPAQAQWPTGLDLYWPILFIQSVKQRTRNSVIDQSKDLWFHCKHGAGDLRGSTQCRDNCPQKQ